MPVRQSSRSTPNFEQRLRSSGQRFVFEGLNLLIQDVSTKPRPDLNNEQTNSQNSATSLSISLLPMSRFQEIFPGPSTVTVPELEIRYDALEGYRSSPTREPRPLMDTCVDLLEIYPQLTRSGTEDNSEQSFPEVVYKRNLGHEGLVEHFLSAGDKNIKDEITSDMDGNCVAEAQKVLLPRLRIIFVKGYILPDSSTYSHQLAGNPLTEIGYIPKTIHYNDVYAAIHPNSAQFLTSQLGVSPAFWAVLLSETWILKTGNCVFRKREPGSERQGEDGDSSTNPLAVEGWYRYSCGLRGYPSHVWFSYTAKTTTYILNNAIPNGIQQSILHCVYAKKLHQMMLAPLVVDGFVAEAASQAWGKEVLKPRLTLVQYERMDGRKAGNDPSESIRDLHILSYNLLIIKEDMIDHIERLQYLIDLHKTLRSLFPFTPSTTSTMVSAEQQQLLGYGNGARKVDVSDTLSFLLSETQIRKRWVQNYADRTAIQINLYYSLSAQRDNETNSDIARFTGKIAKETQRDSSSMITMAAVTMLFLPGTFVSAIFSMVFFDSNKDSSSGIGLSLHRSAWLFPVITIPLTVLVFLVWNLWRTQRNKTHLPQGDSLLEKGCGGSSSIVGSAIWIPQKRRGSSSRSGSALNVRYGSPRSPGPPRAIPVGSPASLSCPSSPLQTPVPLPPETLPCPDSLPGSSQAESPPHVMTKQEVPTMYDLRDFHDTHSANQSVSSLPPEELETRRPSNSPHDTVNADTPALGFDEDGRSISRYGRGTPAWWTRLPHGAQMRIPETGLSATAMMLEDLYPPTAGAIPSATCDSFTHYGPQLIDSPPSRGPSEHSSTYPSDISLPELRSHPLTPADSFLDDESGITAHLRNRAMAHTVIVPEPHRHYALDGPDVLGCIPGDEQPERPKDWEDG